MSPKVISSCPIYAARGIGCIFPADLVGRRGVSRAPVLGLCGDSWNEKRRLHLARHRCRVPGLVSALAAQQPAPKAPPAPAAACTREACRVYIRRPHQASRRDRRACRLQRAGEALLRRLPQRSQQGRAGSLTLASFDIAKAGQDADVAERMIRKLQASMMPPPGMPRPEPATYQRVHHARSKTRSTRTPRRIRIPAAARSSG